MKHFFKNFLAIIFGLLISFAFAEVVLRIYNPLPSRFRGDKIQLKTNLHKKIVLEPKIEGLDSVINYSVNSLGFRGEEKPENFNAVFSIITVGGSTTECSLLDDEKTWSFLLGKKLKNINAGVWLNNAGLDGCTTYGHNILLEDYLLKLKPNMILFLIGVNDRGRKDFGTEDGFLIERRESFFTKLLKKSEFFNLINNLYLAYKTHKINLGHGIKYETSSPKTISEKDETQMLLPHINYQSDYKVRVELLVKKCLNNNIKPVMITQPLLTEQTGWKIMLVYNQTLKQVCDENKILCIDLGSELEKTDKYFYDSMHFTNEGAERVSEIIFEHLKDSVMH